MLLQDGPCKCTDRRVSKCKCFSLQRSRQSPAKDEAPANSRAGTNAKEIIKLVYKVYLSYIYLEVALECFLWASLQYSKGRAC